MTSLSKVKRLLRPFCISHNFYSTGEEVLQNPEPGAAPVLSGATHSWANQEKRKGLGLTGRIYSSRYGGWDYNRHPDYMTYYTDQEGINHPRIKSKSELERDFGDLESQAFRERLKSIPFFDVGINDSDAPPDIQELYGANGSAYASPEQNRNRFLAEMIPALSTAAGSNPIAGMNGTDMNAKKNGWPAERASDPSWFHSDIRAVAYLFTWRVFKEFVSLGGLDQ